MTLVRVTGPRDARRLGPLDPRVTAWRPDLADIALAPMVAAPHYAQPSRMVVTATSTPMLDRPDSNAVAVSELLHGEEFALLDDAHGFGWGYASHDNYVGHVPLDALGPALSPANAMVGCGDGLLFQEPSIKSRVLARLPAGSKLVTDVHDDRFARVAAGPCSGGFIHGRHLLPVEGKGELDWVEVALGFRGAPYLWGGRTRQGIDCSGLVQSARRLAGLSTRRDSDMQAADSVEVPRAEARRGDVACWPGHIGILLDEHRLLHANAWWMSCVVEPLADAEARTSAAVIRRFQSMFQSDEII